MAPNPPLIDVQRAELLRRERQTAVRLVREYGRIYARLQDQIAALTTEIAGMDKPTPAKVRRLARFRALSKTIESEVTRYGTWADTEIMGAASDAAQAAPGLARDLVLSELTPELRAIVATAWNQPSTASMIELLNMLADSAPLHQAFVTDLGPTMAKAVEEALLDGIGLGYNPRKVAAIMRKTLGQGLSWALRTARTSMLYAHRQATMESYRANSSMVKGWIWHAELGPRTCMACIAQHGTKHTLEETLNDHHNGRCLLPGQMVTTRRGSIPIESVQVADMVLTHRGRWRQVTAVSQRPYDGEVYRFGDDALSVTVTSEHPMLTQRGWTAAKDCRAADTFATLVAFDVLDSNRKTVQPRERKRASRGLSDALLSCQHGSCSTANIASGNAKSTLYPSMASWETGDKPASSIAASSFNSFGLENDSHLRWRTWASVILRRRLASGDCIRVIASGRSSIWRKAASLGDIGSMPNARMRRMSVRVLMPSSAQSSRYVACSSTYRRRRYDENGSPSLASISTSSRERMRWANNLDGMCSPRNFARCNTALCVLPGSSSAISIGNSLPNDSRMMRSSNSVHLIPAMLPPFGNGIIIHRPLDIDKSHYAGTVYNLSVADDESYIAGGVVVHNCAMVPTTVSWADLGFEGIPERPPMQTGRDWFEKLPPGQQAAMFDNKAMYRAWQKGAIGWEDLVGEHDDAVYGKMLQLPSLKALLGDGANAYYK